MLSTDALIILIRLPVEAIICLKTHWQGFEDLECKYELRIF